MATLLLVSRFELAKELTVFMLTNSNLRNLLIVSLLSEPDVDDSANILFAAFAMKVLVLGADDLETSTKIG